MHFCNRFLRTVYHGVVNQKLSFLADKAWCHVSEHANAQNNSQWSRFHP
jgi:hypothetical protein